MAQFIAYNSALSTTTAIDPGTSYATGAKVALQLGIPSGGQIELVEWGVSLGTVQATAANLEVCSTATASTMSTAHSTTTICNILDPNGATSRLTMSTSATGFGNGAITSNTSLRPVDRQNLFSSYAKIWPLGAYPKFGATGAAQYLQLRINTAATVNAYAYFVFNELI
jgi:hypothetical protein